MKIELSILLVVGILFTTYTSANSQEKIQCSCVLAPESYSCGEVSLDPIKDQTMADLEARASLECLQWKACQSKVALNAVCFSQN